MSYAVSVIRQSGISDHTAGQRMSEYPSNAHLSPARFWKTGHSRCIGLHGLYPADVGPRLASS